MSKELYVDEKVTTWYRHYFDSEKVTKEKLIEELSQVSDLNHILSEEFGHKYSEEAEGTVEYLTPEENKGSPTIEIYEGDGDSVFQERVWDNAGQWKEDIENSLKELNDGKE